MASQQPSSDTAAPRAISQSPRNIATHALHPTASRTIAFATTALVGPALVGAGVRLLTGSRRDAFIAAGVTGLAALAVRWQFQRWFSVEPTFDLERRVGDLEIRRYAPRVELHTRVATLDFESALDEGFSRLFPYLSRNKLSMTTPVIARPRATTHTIAFIMPPDHTLASLPTPDDAGLHLVEVPALRLAVLRYRGRYSNEKLQTEIARMHELVADAGLSTTGEPMFAGFDPPTTLPFLRRTELWVELVDDLA